MAGSNASPASMQEVEDAMNELIAPVADAKIKLQIIEWGAYDDQINLMLSSGEKLDIFLGTSNIRERGQRGKKTKNELIHIGCPIPFDIEEFLGELDELMEAAYKNREDIRERVEKIVKTYHPS